MKIQKQNKQTCRHLYTAEEQINELVNRLEKTIQSEAQIQNMENIQS